MSRDLVSVVMIFLNAELYIEEAVASVLAQTHADWELLLVDDGSDDGSTAMAKGLADRDPARVRYLEHPGHVNRGMSASRNLGLSHARGRYITFLDSDDVWLPEKLERQIDLLEHHPEAGMVCGPTLWWYSWTGDPRDARRDAVRELNAQPDTLYQPPELLGLLLARRVRTPATCSVLLRREAAESVGGFEESFRGMYEDQAFFAKVYHKIPTFVTGEVWDRYRQHPESHCNVAEREGTYHWARPNPYQRAFLEWLDGYLSGEGERSASLWTPLDRAMWPYRHPRLHRLKGLLTFAWARRTG